MANLINLAPPGALTIPQVMALFGPEQLAIIDPHHVFLGALHHTNQVGSK